MRTPRRIAARAAFCLVLGLVTTFTVSWLLAAFLPQKSWRRQDFVAESTRWDASYGVAVYKTIGATRRTWDVGIPGLTNGLGPFFDAIEGSRYAGFDGAYSPSSAMQRWGTFDEVITQTQLTYLGCEHATGLPFPALWYQIDATLRPRALRVRGGVPISRTTNPPLAFQVRALPYFPVWPGLAMNTLIYAAAWFPLLLSASALRAHLRRRLNLCPRCAYSLLNLPPNSPCPECGHTQGI